MLACNSLKSRLTMKISTHITDKFKEKRYLQLDAPFHIRRQFLINEEHGVKEKGCFVVLTVLLDSKQRTVRVKGGVLSTKGRPFGYFMKENDAEAIL